MKFSEVSIISATPNDREDLIVLLTIRELVFKKMKEAYPMFPNVEDLRKSLSAPYNEKGRFNIILKRLIEHHDILNNLVVTMNGAKKINDYLDMKRKDDALDILSESNTHQAKPVLIKHGMQRERKHDKDDTYKPKGKRTVRAR